LGTIRFCLPRVQRLCGATLLSLTLLGSVAFLPCTARSADRVRIVVDGQTIPVTNARASVRDTLAEGGVKLGANDETSPALDAPVPSDGVIRVSRVTYSEGSIDVKVPYPTVVRPATRGQRPYHPTVTGEGRNGLKRVTYRAKLVDGREVERTTVGETVVREPSPQIVTSRQPYQLGSRGAYTGKRALEMLATAYDPGPGSCGKYANGRTCNGKRAGYGIVAVDPKVIPLGTKLFVEGYGYGIAADVGSAIKGNRVDLGFNSRSGSFAWGKKWVTVRIVD